MSFTIATLTIGSMRTGPQGPPGSSGSGVDGPESSTDDAIATWDGTDGGTLQNSLVTINSSTGAITTPSTVDGRDLSVDGAALDAHIGAGGGAHANAIASGAAGFLSGSDKAKLDGIEAGADVTDATNVNAAGAVMEGDAAGGSLGGTYPNPTIAAGAVGGAEIASAIKDPSAGTAGLRTLGTSSTSACAGDDSRLSDSRAPTAHASTHLPGGTDALTTAAAVGLTDSSNTEGNATSFARSNHTHAHGARGGGTLHAVATPSAAGFQQIATPITESTTSRTLADSDHDRVILCAHADGCAVGVPGTLTPGFRCLLIQRGAAAVTATGSGGLTMTPEPTFVASTFGVGSGMLVIVESATVGNALGDLASA